MFLSEKGQAENKKGSIGGDVELDAHQVAKVYVSTKNPFYKHLIPEKYKKKPPAYFVMYVQVAGAIQRGCGKLYVSFLPSHMLLPPKARPPPESFEGVEKTQLADNIQDKSNLHFDGNKSWPKLANTKYAKKAFRTPSVVHGDHQFTKKIRARRFTQSAMKVQLAKLAGTQTIDRSWIEMDRAVPSTLVKKKKAKGSPHRKVHEQVYARVWSWLYRFNKRHQEITATQALKSLVQALNANEKARQ